MLRSMRRRGRITRSVISQAEGAYIGIGICENAPVASQRHRSSGSLTVAMDGFFYDEEENVDEVLRGRNLEGLSKILALPGAFSFVAATDRNLVAGRDPVGQKPLYYGEGAQGTAAFASLRTALINIKVKNPQPVPPGTVLVSSTGGIEPADDSFRLKQESEQTVTESECVDRIHEDLGRAVSQGFQLGTGVAFSGGLDSALVASLAKEVGKDPDLFTVGMEEQPELEHAREVATELGLPITIRELTADEVLESLPDVVSIVESTDPVVVGVSVPFYFACRKAREMGRELIAAGQMSDELFGGYARFEDLVLNGRPDEARSEIWRSVLAAPANDFEPGDKVAVSFGLEMRCPFAYLPLVEYGLNLPLSLKVSALEGRAVRKYILRRLASTLKLPDSVVNRPKKAVQYSSGVQKVLIKEAKRRNLTLDKFLMSFEKEAYPVPS